MEQIIEKIMNVAVEYGLDVIGAILILVAGRIGAGIARRVVRRALEKSNVEPTVTGFIGRLAYIGVIVVAVLASLAKFGVQTTSFVAVLAAMGFAIGMALQGSLSHFAAGVLILLFRPFRVGDFIDVDGIMGSVEEIRLFTTMMSTPDNVRMFVPNSKIFNGVIKNFSVNETRRIDVTVGISYGDSIDRAMQVALDVMKLDNRIFREPEPQIVVTSLGDSSVDLLVRCWTKRGDFWPVKCDLIKNIKEHYDVQGIEIPFPQRVVHTK